MCEMRCECLKGFARDNRTGQCIPKEECLAPPQCPENEELVCTTCSEPSCSQHEIMCGGTASSPNDVTEGCVDIEACYCIPGFKRMYNSHDPADRGVCVPEDQCPIGVDQCGPHEHFEDCVFPCWEEMCCPDGSSQCVVGDDTCWEDDCQPMCVCDLGYIRDQHGACVESCTGGQDDPSGHQCPGNMVWNDCGSNCHDIYCCPDGNGPGCGADVHCTDECVPQCECPWGGIPTDSETGCMTYEEACGMIPVPVECGENASWNDCGNPCFDHFCCDWDTACWEEGIGCNGSCMGRCECHPGFTWGPDSHNCIPIEEFCTPTCRENEQWNSCGSGCAERHCCDSNDKGHCKEDNCPEACEPRCECVSGYARDHATGYCIPKNDCSDGHWCPDGEHFSDCMHWCDEPKCGGGWCDAHDGSCHQGCTCSEGFVRDPVTLICIPQQDCYIQECENNDPFAMWVENQCNMNELYCCNGQLCGFQRSVSIDPTTTTTSTTTATTIGQPPAPGGGSGGGTDGTCQYPWTGCTCQPGFAYHPHKYICVPEQECYEVPECPEGEIYKSCEYCYEDTCNSAGYCHRSAAADPSGNVDDGWQQCPISGCFCPEGTIRNYNPDGTSSCVESCEAALCGVNEFWNTCASPCGDINCEGFDECGNNHNARSCVERCSCLDGYVRDWNHPEGRLHPNV